MVEGRHRKERLNRERLRLLLRAERWLETPMLALAGAWIVLTAVDLTRGLTPLLERTQQVIWVVFLAEFGLRFTIAPRKLAFLRQNAVTLVALALPALRLLRVARLLRVLRAARAVRGLRLAKVLGTLNRGMRSLGGALQRRGFGYVAALTGLATLLGAAGMLAFEDQPGGLRSYGDALWWTAMLMTTLGSEYWPRTAEGRLLAFVLALFAFTVFGYITATLASFFVDRDAEREDGPLAGAAELRALRAEIAALRRELGLSNPAGAGLEPRPVATGPVEGQGEGDAVERGG